MNRIEVMSRRFQWFFLLVFWGIPVVHLLVWLSLEPGKNQPLDWEIALSGLEGIEIIGDIGWPARAMGLAAGMLSGGFEMVAMWCLYRLFGQFAQNELFTPSTVLLLRRTGLMLIFAQCMAPVSAGLSSIAATLGNPVGQRMFSIGLSDADIFGVVFGLALMFAARLMDEARILRENDALTI